MRESHKIHVPNILRLVPCVTKHLVHRRDTSSGSWVTSSFQQRSCERFHCQTRQQTAPPSVKPCAGPGTARMFAFLWTIFRHFTCNNHHPGSSSRPTQFWVPVFLPLASVLQNHSVGCVCFPQRLSISMVRRHQRRVQSQMHLQRGTNLLQSPPARIRVPLRDVLVSHHDVGGHPGPTFATDLGDNTLHGITSPVKHPHRAEDRQAAPVCSMPPAFHNLVLPKWMLMLALLWSSVSNNWNTSCSGWSADHVHVVQECEEFLILVQLRLHGNQRSVLTKAEFLRHQRVSTDKVVVSRFSLVSAWTMSRSLPW